MTWTTQAVIVWDCDVCGAELIVPGHAEDQPGGWSHTMDGRDLCVECSRKAQAGLL